MTFEQAQRYCQQYQELLADAEKRGARRSPSLLPTDKSTLLRAIRLVIAGLHAKEVTDPEAFKPLLEAAMFIDTFSDNPVDSPALIASMQERRQEMDAFYHDILNIDPSDPFFWQRIYVHAGVSSDTSRITFFDTIRLRLSRQSSVNVVASPTSPPERSAQSFGTANRAAAETDGAEEGHNFVKAGEPAAEPSCSTSLLRGTVRYLTSKTAAVAPGTVTSSLFSDSRGGNLAVNRGAELGTAIRKAASMLHQQTPILMARCLHAVERRLVRKEGHSKATPHD